ncbi:MAG: hypothetical protein ACXV2I_12675 [Actinomycetes bacterium]
MNNIHGIASGTSINQSAATMAWDGLLCVRVTENSTTASGPTTAITSNARQRLFSGIRWWSRVAITAAAPASTARLTVWTGSGSPLRPVTISATTLVATDDAATMPTRVVLRVVTS